MVGMNERWIIWENCIGCEGSYTYSSLPFLFVFSSLSGVAPDTPVLQTRDCAAQLQESVGEAKSLRVKKTAF